MMSICQLLRNMELNHQSNFLDFWQIEKGFSSEENGHGLTLKILLLLHVLPHQAVQEPLSLQDSPEDSMFFVYQKPPLELFRLFFHLFLKNSSLQTTSRKKLEIFKKLQSSQRLRFTQESRKICVQLPLNSTIFSI